MPFLVDVFTTATLVGQVVLGLFVLLMFYQYFSKKKIGLLNKWASHGKEHSVKISFILSLTATLGSLYLSKILGWAPCEMCWYQRIVMYPLVVVFGVGLLTRDKRVFNYALPLIIMGLLLSSYHYYIQVNQVVTGCSINPEESCSNKFTFAYGYITIPMMAFSVFASMLVLGLLNKRWKK